ncbi:glycerophosphodiester phosphodiesterase [Bacillus sp. FJAT-44742]|uniref:glycerophosphodiester phosphodiesterase n=1 Tax=Bacillus sp. FJAT-44742 TaxID=2014005 RepID=UPI000C24F24C|nr:glycerophosphodiester phosphodiesterase [Bacillus sp. FJAT-44742]
MTNIFAHRGASITHPENTMAAFQAAVDAGAEGIELDVQLTKDEEVVVIHDNTVNRTTDGFGAVHELTAKEISKLDAGSWRDASFRGEKVPLLKDVLEWLTDKEILINIELKKHKPGYETLAKKVTDVIKEHNVQKKIILSSFYHSIMVDLHQNHPDIESALLVTAGLYDPLSYMKSTGITSLHANVNTITVKEMQELQRHGIKVRVYTVNNPIEIKCCIKAGFDTVMTDDPAAAVKLRNRHLEDIKTTQNPHDI